MKITVSIILVNYNTCKLTCECIASIIQHVQSVDYEIIVVDNHSNDETAIVVPHSYPQVKYIQADSNLGFGRANNLGATYATGEYLFLLNTDTILCNDPFPFFIDVIKKTDKTAVVGTFLKDKQGNYVESGGENYSIHQRLEYAFRATFRIGFRPKCDFSLDVTNVDYVIGADMFIPYQIFKKYNGFDEKIFMYFEEAELCKRLKRDGYQLYLTKGPEIIHLIKGSSGGGGSMFSKVYSTASIMYCIRKESQWLQFKIFQVALFITRLPVLLDYRYKFSENIRYLCSIFNYKKYLVN